MGALIPILMGVTATLAVIIMMTRGRQTMLRICLALAVPAFFGGIVLYTLCFMPENGGFGDMVTAMLRGLFSTGRMFLINDDYGFIVDDPSKVWLVNSLAFQVIFWLCHTLALIVSVSAVMGVFGYHLINTMRLRLRFYDSCTLTCGDSENALALGENILTHDGALKSPDTSKLVVHLSRRAVDDLQETISTQGSITIEYDKSNFQRQLKKAGLAARAWRIKTFRIILMDESDAQLMWLLHEVLNCAVGLSIPASRLSIHLLSESPWVIEYAQALHDRSVACDDDSGVCPYTLHLAGESDLAARHMILTLPPYRALTFDRGIAQQDFTVLVLGFGRTGVQALRRLIINGQFVGSTMRAIVVDTDIESCRGLFEQTYPGLSACCQIDYHALDVRSADFFGMIAALEANIHYIVAALNSDALNFEVARLLLDHYQRMGRPAPHLALAVADGHGEATESIQNIVFFSQRSDIYSETTVIRDEVDRMAMMVNSAYVQSTQADPPSTDARHLWHKLDSFTQESNRAAADFIPAMLHLSDLTEDVAAGLDALTEDEALAVVLSQTEHLRWNAFHYAMGYTTMPLSAVNRRFKTLYDAGDRPANCRKDTDRKQHACLVPWEELPRVSETLNKLFEEANLATRRNFQADDRAVILSIPLSLREKQRAAGKETHSASL